MTESGVLYYGQDKIGYDIVRRDTASSKTGKPRKVRIQVHPDQRVVATAPMDASEAVIHEAMMKRARWIWHNLQGFAKQNHEVLPRRYVSGETQFYLGRRYVLKVLTEDSAQTNVKLSRGKLTVTVLPVLSADARREQVKYLLEGWYQQKAEAVFDERLRLLLPKAVWVAGVPSFRILAMQKQWGSCSVKGNLMLNPHLIKAPKDCIDYVILHELCHIAEHNHSERFWRLLTQVMPEHKSIKRRLDSMAELYLND